jgi:GTP-binding protein
MSFRREKHVPRGGPDGGDGGKGGDVWLEADADLATLIDIKYRPSIKAGRARHGQGAQKSGRDGEDKVVRVPLGTVISDEAGPLADLTQPGERYLVAAGGRGGLGNQHFATSTNQAPRRCYPGEPGQERALILELKLIADVGLVGLPNAGKSTLLAALKRATPKIDAYPFTTLHPNLGMMAIGEERAIAVADIPGLIEGASRGVGLGDRFLRHIERTGLLVHLIAPDPSIGERAAMDAEEARIAGSIAAEAYRLVREELKTYSARIAAKPEIVALTKIDLIPEAARAAYLAGAEAEGAPKPIAISAATGEGLEALRAAIERRLPSIESGGALNLSAASDPSDLSDPSDPSDD